MYIHVTLEFHSDEVELVAGNIYGIICICTCTIEHSTRNKPKEKQTLYKFCMSSIIAALQHRVIRVSSCLYPHTCHSPLTSPTSWPTSSTLPGLTMECPFTPPQWSSLFRKWVRCMTTAKCQFPVGQWFESYSFLDEFRVTWAGMYRSEAEGAVIVL